eukprot:11307108-Alexandrium_andersonii.AAC.1
MDDLDVSRVIMGAPCRAHTFQMINAVLRKSAAKHNAHKLRRIELPEARTDIREVAEQEKYEVAIALSEKTGANKFWMLVSS